MLPLLQHGRFLLDDVVAGQERAQENDAGVRSQHHAAGRRGASCRLRGALLFPRSVSSQRSGAAAAPSLPFPQSEHNGGGGRGAPGSPRSPAGACGGLRSPHPPPTFHRCPRPGDGERGARWKGGWVWGGGLGGGRGGVGDAPCGEPGCETKGGGPSVSSGRGSGGVYILIPVLPSSLRAPPALLRNRLSSGGGGKEGKRGGRCIVLFSQRRFL